MAVDLAADDEGHHVPGARLPVERLDAAIVDIVGGAFDLDEPRRQLEDAGLIIADRAQQGHHLGQHPGGLHDDAAHVAHLRLERIEFEEGDRLGGGVHLIDRVVHHADQARNGGAIEGRDQDLANVLQHGARDVVRFVLAIMDRADMLGDVRPALEQPRQRIGARDEQGGMFLEQLEEAPLLGHQRLKPAQHCKLLPALRPHP